MYSAKLFISEMSSHGDLSEINKTLSHIGVYLSRFDIPAELRPILQVHAERSLDDEEYRHVLKTMALDGRSILKIIDLAGRLPAIPGGGELSTQEGEMPPYPKIYDLISMNDEIRQIVNDKFSRLHVNCTDDKISVDEVMSCLCGGPWVWYFVMPDKSVVKLQLELSDDHLQGWRLYYPGMTVHGAQVGKHGLCLAQAIGPKNWLTRYKMSGIENEELLGTNPWLK